VRLSVPFEFRRYLPDRPAKPGRRIFCEEIDNPLDCRRILFPRVAALRDDAPPQVPTERKTRSVPAVGAGVRGSA
jgi:hypothetical protein